MYRQEVAGRRTTLSDWRTDDMIPKRNGGMAAPGNGGRQQGAKISFQARISWYLLALALPAGAQERDKILFKAIIPPVIGIESRDNRREPPDSSNKETDGCGLHDPMEKTWNQFRLLTPPLGDPREKAFHSAKGGREV
jgi:hypothetical protein